MKPSQSKNVDAAPLVCENVSELIAGVENGNSFVILKFPDHLKKNEKEMLEEIKKLANFFTKNKKASVLQSLDMSGNQIGYKGVAAFIFSIAKSGLLEVDISNNNIGDYGALEIAKALFKYPILMFTRLFISNNQISDVGVGFLTKFFEKHPFNCLRVLDMSGNLIGNSGVASIAESLKKNKCLKELYLHENAFDDSAAETFVRMFHESSLASLVTGLSEVDDQIKSTKKDADVKDQAKDVKEVVKAEKKSVDNKDASVKRARSNQQRIDKYFQKLGEAVEQVKMALREMSKVEQSKNPGVEPAPQNAAALTDKNQRTV
jgi:Ran GTPase-activating protein (RanGAP) involved in mRNA processing and transport